MHNTHTIPHSRKVPVLLVGAPGTGKTAHVLAAYDYVEVMLASTLVEEDIAGLPYREGDYDYRTIPAIFRRLHEADAAGHSTCLFFDELDKARRSVADTLLTLIASRRIGASVLPDRTEIMAAANPPELGGGDGVSDAMISRFAVVPYVPDPVQWSDWAAPRYPHPACQRIISAVGCGELPCLDIAGEGLDRRITSPRTITYCMDIISEGNHRCLISGLVTAATASQIYHFMDATSDDVMHVATGLCRSSATAQSKREPLRL